MTINFVTTRDYGNAMQKLLDGSLGRLPFAWRQWSYEGLLRRRRIRSGTWIFQDIERLTQAERLRAAAIAGRLEENGAKVLNHPLRAAARYELQRKLFNAGINQFQTYRADEHRTPQRWPVFIRHETNHRSPDAALYHSAEALQAALAGYQAQSVPLGNLLLVEYCGEPMRDGLWRKYSAYRVGDELIHHHIVRQDCWVAKYGNPSLQFDDATWTQLRTEERDFVMQQGDPYWLLPAFQLGGLEFGRADFNFVQGRPQIYEINTNPTIGVADPQAERFPAMPRAPILRHANDRIIRALQRLDTPPGARIDIADINFIRGLPWRPVKRI